MSYKSCIVKTYNQMTGDHLDGSGTLTDFCKNLAREVPREKFKFPKWDLTIVLKGLREAPFEPLEDIDLKYLSFKTVFLIALASAARVSELHALSAESGFIRFTVDKSTVFLAPVIGFLAKNQRPDEAPREMSINSLRNHAPPGDPERLLCPVRALRAYLTRTNKFRGKRKKLFLSLMPKKRTEITVHTLSRWLRETIKLTYQFQKPHELAQLYSIPVHEIRALAASLPVYQSASILDVLKTASWKHHNTFTDFYLRDLSVYSKKLSAKDGDMVVAAGKEINLKL